MISIGAIVSSTFCLALCIGELKEAAMMVMINFEFILRVLCAEENRMREK